MSEQPTHLEILDDERAVGAAVANVTNLLTDPDTASAFIRIDRFNRKGEFQAAAIDFKGFLKQFKANVESRKDKPEQPCLPFPTPEEAK